MKWQLYITLKTKMVLCHIPKYTRDCLLYINFDSLRYFFYICIGQIVQLCVINKHLHIVSSYETISAMKY